MTLVCWRDLLAQAASSTVDADLEAQVLAQLSRIIDPDFGTDIVECGFVNGMSIDAASGKVAFTLELTTPACPVKDQFKREATEYVQVRGRQGGVGVVKVQVHGRQVGLGVRCMCQRSSVTAAAWAGRQATHTVWRSRKRARRGQCTQAQQVA